MTLIALHGFLGSPSDWNFWPSGEWGVKTFVPYTIGSASSCEEWAEQFNQEIIAKTKAPRFLMGYSMGGRLALHALSMNPSMWEAGILISTHPGLQTDSERAIRLLHDQKWAEKFKNEPWDKVMQEWNKQPIFQNTYSFERSEQDRTLLVQQLTNFSLGRQNDLRRNLPRLPLIWVIGELDTLYRHYANEICKLHPFSTHLQLSDAGHRAPWDAPEKFSELIKPSIKKLMF